MIFPDALNRAGCLIAIILVILEQVRQPVAAQVGAQVLKTHITRGFTNRGGNLGVKFHESQPFYSSNSSPFKCMVIGNIDILGALPGTEVSVGDHICSVDGYFFESAEGIANYISSKSSSDFVNITYSRPPKDKYYRMKIKLTSFDQLSFPFRTIRDDIAKDFTDVGGRLGIGWYSSNVNIGSVRDPNRTLYTFYAASVGKINSYSGVDNTDINIGDRIFSINEFVYNSESAYLSHIASYYPGSIVRVRYMRPNDDSVYITNVRLMTIGGLATLNRESSNKQLLGWLGLGLGLLALGAIASDSSPSQSSTNNVSREEDNSGRQNNGAIPTQREQSRDSNATPSVKPIDPFYGSCHGGSFYGC